MNGAITFPERIFFLAVDRRHLVLIRRRTPVGVRPKTDCGDDCGDPHTPQPRRADHERSVSGHNSLFLGYPEPARVGIGVGVAVRIGVVRNLVPQIAALTIVPEARPGDAMSSWN